MTKIANLVETTWLTRYTWPTEITYNQGLERFGHKFINNLIEEEYGIKSKPDYSGKPQTKYIIERIHKVFCNLVHTYYIQETYIDDSNQWVGILDETYISV